MKNVLLVCAQGISSHLFLGEAKRVAETRQAPLHFSATSLAELTPELIAQQDLVLLAPQAAYHNQIDAYTAQNVQVAVIPNDIYGWLNSEALVKFANQTLNAVVAPAMASL
ncbi:cellobiose PTS IIC subunit [Levilactobacillus zymae]|uniref:PTS sugar transporter subunit IIB n=1 Tax=Levilactobacillus zymae TaxID=267363 RepID=UPI0028BA6F5D|nr:cellobiose PTS IIC subunit [Levilactobacillus zymae]MDT6979997.1 cellobiose PTS IIC subunit [Levilactobacillus zymae]